MARDIESPAFLCLSPDGRFLYAASEVPERAEGVIGAYAVSPGDGMLEPLGFQGMGGAWASYLTTDPRGRALLLSDYGDGRVALLPVLPDGRLGEVASAVQHSGSGPDPVRQDGPHAHCIVVSPDDRFAFAADLGADRIFGYRCDWDRLELVPHREWRTAAGSGPRHLVFAPDGRHAYLVGELDSTVTTMASDAADGTFAPLDTLPLLPDGFDGQSTGADIHVHPSGRFLYCSNRGHDSITTFAIDPASGRLAPLGHRSSEGHTPRNFAISHDGRFLLAGNQDSDTIVTMPIDPDTGLLGETVAVTEVPTPACLVFAPA